MSQAESLLSSLSGTARATVSSPVNDLLIVDAESRIINVPSTEILFGVETDLNVERKYFLCPRYVGDNIDLSTLKLQIHFRNALGDKSKYTIKDLAVNEEYVTFSWLLEGLLFAAKGTVGFSIRGYSAEDGVETCVWNTAMATGTVLEGLVAYSQGSSSGTSSYDGLPVVTEDDNDKMLLVVDGDWQLIESEIPEEVIDSWFDE